jgi:hypothetical protein
LLGGRLVVGGGVELAFASMRRLEEAEIDILRATCREIAKCQLPALVDVAVREKLVADLLGHAQTVAQIHERAPVEAIVRAVRYLAYTHAIPPMGTNSDWFWNMLECLIELAFPITGQYPTAEPFLRDLERGIAATRAAMRTT